MTINLLDLIKPVSEAPPYLKLCIFGEYSSGKTTLAAGAPNPVIIDTEGSTVVLLKDPVLKDTPIVQRKNLDECLEIIDALRGPGGDRYETVVIDTFSELSKLFLDSVMKSNTDVEMKDYERRNLQGRRFISELFSLNKHIIILCHVDVVDINGIKKKAPQTSTKMRQQILGLCDVVGYMSTQRVPDPSDGNPTAMKTVRVIQTANTPTVEAKNRLDVPDLIESPTVEVFFSAHRRNIDRVKKPEVIATPTITQTTNLGLNI